jgi:hypothetical protein
MKLSIAFLLVALLAPAAASSATLEAVVNVLAFPVGTPERDAYAPGTEWAAIARFPGIKWRDRGLQEGYRGESARSGSIELTGLGRTSISWVGTTDRAFTAGLQTSVRLSPDQYAPIVRANFSPAAKVRSVRAGCKTPAMTLSAVFEVTLPGKQPAYVFINTSDYNNDKTRLEIFPYDQTEGRWSCP